MKRILLSLVAVLAITLGAKAQSWEWGTAVWNIEDGTTFDDIESFEMGGLRLSYPNPTGYNLTFLNMIAVDYNIYVDGGDTPVTATASARQSVDVNFGYSFAEGHSYRIETTNAVLVQVNLATYSTDTLSTNTDKYTVSFTIKGPEIVDTVSVDGTMALTITDQNSQLTYSKLDTAAIKTALGVSAMSEVTTYGLNVNGSYNANFEDPFDGWRDADGEYTTYYSGWSSILGHNAYPAVYSIKLSANRDSVFYYFYDYWRVYNPDDPTSIPSQPSGAKSYAPNTSYHTILWEWQDGDSTITYQRSYRCDEGTDYPASFILKANNKAVLVNATMHFVSQEAYAAYRDSVGTEYSGFLKAGIAMRQDPSTSLASTSTDQTVTIKKGSGDGLVDITFSGFTLPMMNMPTNELTLTDVTAVTDADGNVTYSLESQVVGLKRGQMTINYTAALTGTQAAGETPQLTLTLSQATVITAVFGATQELAEEAYNAVYTPTGIGGVAAEATGADSYYDINGRAIAAPVKGVNIVKKADGKVLKVIVK